MHKCPGEISLCYNVRFGVHSLEGVSNEDGDTADAAAKIMIPSRAPDPLNTALSRVARLYSYIQYSDCSGF